MVYSFINEPLAVFFLSKSKNRLGPRSTANIRNLLFRPRNGKQLYAYFILNFRNYTLKSIIMSSDRF